MDVLTRRVPEIGWRLQPVGAADECPHRPRGPASRHLVAADRRGGQARRGVRVPSAARPRV